MSISTTFYERLFQIKVSFAAFLCLQFVFVIFWQKEICKNMLLNVGEIAFFSFLINF